MKSGQSKMLRLFVAASLPENVRRGLAGRQHELKAHKLPIRWVVPANIHLTLTFLGDTRPQLVESIAAAMRPSVKGHQPMRLAAAGCGVFPRLKNPRVLWVGLNGDIAALEALKKTLDPALAGLGLEFGKNVGRTFRPHLTLGRFRHKIAPAKVAAALRVMGQNPPIPFEVDQLHLYQSTLTPQGAIYDKLASAPLDIS